MSSHAAGNPRTRKARKALAAASEALSAKAALAVIEAVSATGDDVVSVRLLFIRGLAFRHSRRLQESAGAFRAAADAAERLGWLARAAAGFRESGLSEYDRSGWRRALEAGERRLAIEELRANRPGVATTLGNIGAIHWRLGAFAIALKYEQRALKLKQELKDRTGVARSFGNVGLIYGRLGAYAKALTYQERALKLSKEVKDRAGMAAALGGIGNIHLRLGAYPKALVYQEQALKLKQEIRDSAAVARALGDIGLTHERLGVYAKALVYQERALKLKQELGNHADAAGTLGNIGNIHARLGAYAKALEYHERALGLCEELQDRAGVAAVLGDLGIIHGRLGAYAKALAYQERALKLRQELGDRAGEATTLGNIGIIHHMLGAYAKALAYQERALKLMEELGHRADVARTLGNIGNIHWSLGAYTKALAYQEGALKLSQGLENRAGIAATLANIGLTHEALSDLDGARRFLERSVRTARSLRATPLLVGALTSLARVHMSTGKPSMALAAAQQALREVEGLLGGLGEEQGAQSRETHADLFALGALAAAREDDVAEALTFLESGRAGALLDALGKREALRWKAESLSPELRQLDIEAGKAERAARLAYDTVVQRRGTREEISSAAGALDEATDALRDVASRIQRELKQQARLFYPRAETIDTIQAALERDQALVLYGLCLDEALALVLRHDAGRIVRLGRVAEITRACEALDATDVEVDPIAALNALRRLLVEPLALGKDVKQLLLSPEGPLCYIPFGALFEQPVAMTPSGTTHVLLLAEERARGDAILALGDPDYRGASKGAQAVYYKGRSLAPLPATRAEAEAIGTVTLLGAKASEAGFYSALRKGPAFATGPGDASVPKRWRAVHFGCHGLVNVDQPMLSSLALAREGEHDGFLTALEIMRTKIPADLAVLSACETARGRIVRGEGILGLTRAFMFAGAPRVIVSLWKVDDQATHALMVKFYECWNDRSAVTALKQAQQSVRSREKWRHPYYWAAWQLWGLPE